MNFKFFMTAILVINSSLLQGCCSDYGIKPETYYSDDVYEKISKEYDDFSKLLKSKNISKDDVDAIIVYDRQKKILVKVKDRILPYCVDFIKEGQSKVAIKISTYCPRKWLTDQDLQNMENTYNRVKEEIDGFTNILKTKNIKKSDICFIKYHIDQKYVELKICEKIGTYFITVEEKNNLKVATEIQYMHNAV